ncbi:MAG: DUF1824 family protein [Limnoraphis robusta]|uniref:DUF1824 family protein n=1 Tax=Limnoraphis robusta TaxID=1118279 RepID=UPI002B21B65A|nr:DUF1824 family protein [Limnoraphis robusta]MEA5497972.1 DUF1824 family protein [Limnoraphis robusta BA-68 BA1]
MSSSQPANLSIETAQKILEAFTCADIQSVNPIENRASICEALHVLVQNSEYQMLGICADSLDAAWNALEQYLQGLDYHNITLNRNAIEAIEGSVYLKFNGRSQSYYASPYTQQYRGVLVSCQSSDETGVNGTYGHFPINLFSDIAKS